MATKTSNSLQQICRSVAQSATSTRTDAQLLEDFIGHNDHEAIEALVRRHGPMVRGVCRRILSNEHDAEDAFQATFLVLVRRASSIWPREVVPSWLHAVAQRTALKARTLARKRQGRERQVAAMPEPELPQRESWADIRLILDRELGYLPEKYRLPIILCDLENRSIKEATRQLGWPQGTVAGRLARARALLARRLTQRGITASTAVLTALLSQEAASACVPRLVKATCSATALLATGHSLTTAATSARVAAVTKGVLNSMMIAKGKLVTAVLMLAVVLTTVAGLVARNAQAMDGVAAAPGQEATAHPQPELPPVIHKERLYTVECKVVELLGDGEKTLAQPRIQTVDGRPFGVAIRSDIIDLEQEEGKTVKADGAGLSFQCRLDRRKNGNVRFDASLANRELVKGKNLIDLVGTTARSIGDVQPGKWKSLEVESKNEPGKRYRLDFRISHIEDTTREHYFSSDERKPSPARVGQIIIVGNEKTSEAVILKQIPLVPGQLLSMPALREAEQNLAALRLFVMDEKKGIRPTVAVVDTQSESPYKDILVKVKERAADRNLPAAMFPEGQQHDFGTVVRGIEATCSLPIVNTTNAPITFGLVRMSTGAVKASVTRKVLQPNEKAELRVSVDTNRFAGPKTATIYLNVQTAQGPQRHEVSIVITSQDTPTGAAPMLAPQR